MLYKSRLIQPSFFKKGSYCMFDTSRVGESFPPFKIQVERGKIRELAIAVGDDNPIYQSVEAAQAAGYNDIPLFPTAPTIFQFWGNTQMLKNLLDLGLNVMGILHGEEEFEYLAPIQNGDTLTGTTKLRDGKSRKGPNGSSMDILNLETSYSNQHGQVVLIARETIIVRG